MASPTRKQVQDKLKAKVLNQGGGKLQLPTKDCHSPPGSAKMKSLANAVADIQHTLKGVKGKLTKKKKKHPLMLCFLFFKCHRSQGGLVI